MFNAYPTVPEPTTDPMITTQARGKRSVPETAAAGPIVLGPTWFERRETTAHANTCKRIPVSLHKAPAVDNARTADPSDRVWDGAHGHWVSVGALLTASREACEAKREHERERRNDQNAMELFRVEVRRSQERIDLMKCEIQIAGEMIMDAAKQNDLCGQYDALIEKINDECETFQFPVRNREYVVTLVLTRSVEVMAADPDEAEKLALEMNRDDMGQFVSYVDDVNVTETEAS